MPITLGCPSCMKRFRARDESAGKRVKCPYCGAAVSVPTAEESASAAAPTAAIPPPPPVPAKPAPRSPFDDSGGVPPHAPRPGAAAVPPAPAPVATPDDWGASEPAPRPAPTFEVMPPPPPAPAPLDFPKPATAGRPTKAAPAPRRATRVETRAEAEGTKTPEQLAAPGWRKTRVGLFWVLFALFLLALPGFVGFGKMVYARSVEELPKGDGWVSIPGYINDPAPGAVKMSKPEQLDVALYGAPVFLAGLFLGLGRLTCGAAPRSSGAKGMFAFSGLFTLLGLAALVAVGVADKLLLKDTYRYAWTGFLILGLTAEFWFLNGLTASGAALKRPKAPRAVGGLGFVLALAALASTLGWTIYSQELKDQRADADWRMYEQAAVMIGWLLLIGMYWRAVRSVRAAISEFLETVEE